MVMVRPILCGLLIPWWAVITITVVRQGLCANLMAMALLIGVFLD